MIIKILIILLSLFWLKEAQAITLDKEEYTDILVRYANDDSKTMGHFTIYKDANTDKYYYQTTLPLQLDSFAVETTANNCADFLNISDETWYRLNNITYFGYGYDDHLTKEWLVITQYMIWETLGYKIEILNTKGDNLFFEYYDLYKEINSLIDYHLILPSYFEEDLEFSIDELYPLVDKNNVEKYYEFFYDNNLKIDNNYGTKYLHARKPEKFTMYAIRRANSEKNYVYYNDDIRLISRGNTALKTYSVNVNVHGGKIKIINTGLYGQRLTGATYFIYDSNDKLVTNLIAHSYKDAITVYLPCDNYYIVEQTPSVGYIKNTEVINFEFEDQDISEVIVKSKPIKANVNIKATYKTSLKTLNEVGAKFSVYKDDVILETKETDVEGMVTFNLPFGEYTIKQEASTLGFPLQDELPINISDTEDLNLTVENNLETTVFNIKLIGFDDNYLIQEIIIGSENDKYVVDDYQIEDDVLTFEYRLDPEHYQILISMNNHLESIEVELDNKMSLVQLNLVQEEEKAEKVPVKEDDISNLIDNNMEDEFLKTDIVVTQDEAIFDVPQTGYEQLELDYIIFTILIGMALILFCLKKS